MIYEIMTSFHFQNSMMTPCCSVKTSTGRFLYNDAIKISSAYKTPYVSADSPLANSTQIWVRKFGRRGEPVFAIFFFAGDFLPDRRIDGRPFIAEPRRFLSDKMTVRRTFAWSAAEYFVA